MAETETDPRRVGINRRSPYLVPEENNFSLYTSENDKFRHRADAKNMENVNSFNSCAFPSWSPIASNFEMTPGHTNVQEKVLTREKTSSSKEKPSYSDILLKCPVKKNVCQTSNVQTRTTKPAVKNLFSVDSRSKKEKVLHKWFSLDNLEQDASTNLPKSTSPSTKSKLRGHSSPGLLDNNKNKSHENVEKKVSDVFSGKTQKKVQNLVEVEVKMVNQDVGNGKSYQVDVRNKKMSHKRNMEKSSKENSKKSNGGNGGSCNNNNGSGSVKKKKSGKSKENFDHICMLVIAQLYICAVWINQSLIWLVNLIYDVSFMSCNLSWHLLQITYAYITLKTNLFCKWMTLRWNKMVPRLTFFSRLFPAKKKESNNISLPATREEAMKRLLSCKDKDPYSILGVSPSASDDEIKKYYRKQAVLVHPDKNGIVGAEEAFKVLAHAFELIGEPERRRLYDSKRLEAQQIETTWNEFSDLLTQLQEKMDEVANTIKCTNCNRRHRRVKMDRPCYSARFCAPCKIMHAAREGDIWAESRMFGLIWNYYACMDAGIYDITEWAGCQAKNLKHLRANSHSVQYRIISSSKKSTPAETMPSDNNFEEFLRGFDKKNVSGANCKGESSKKKRNKRK